MLGLIRFIGARLALPWCSISKGRSRQFFLSLNPGSPKEFFVCFDLKCSENYPVQTYGFIIREKITWACLGSDKPDPFVNGSSQA